MHVIFLNISLRRHTSQARSKDWPRCSEWFLSLKSPPPPPMYNFWKHSLSLKNWNKVDCTIAEVKSEYIHVYFKICVCTQLCIFWHGSVVFMKILWTHSHTMTPFDESGKEAFWKHRGKRRNCLYKQFLLFPQCFLLYQRQKLSFLLHLICHLQMLSIWSGPKFCRVGMVGYFLLFVNVYKLWANPRTSLALESVDC